MTLGSAADKANYVLQRGLGGAMLWDLPQDDFSVSHSIFWFLQFIFLLSKVVQVQAKNSKINTKLFNYYFQISECMWSRQISNFEGNT